MTSKPLQRILHVDDEPDIREVAKLSLEDVGGFTVEVCSSGAEAIERAAAVPPDLILLDVMMPGMDGPATLKALRDNAQTVAIPVVFMTAKVQAREIETLKGLGAVGVIAKPFDPLQLAEQVRVLWAESALVE
jgi:CheY-like chemotaxis protein